jgi:hypothetical protein
MTKLIIDEALRAKLKGLNEHIELYAEDGQEIGHFVPGDMYRVLADAWVHSLFTKEELRCAEGETGGRPLVEIWKSLGRG